MTASTLHLDILSYLIECSGATLFVYSYTAGAEVSLPPAAEIYITLWGWSNTRHESSSRDARRRCAVASLLLAGSPASCWHTVGRGGATAGRHLPGWTR